MFLTVMTQFLGCPVRKVSSIIQHERYLVFWVFGIKNETHFFGAEHNNLIYCVQSILNLPGGKLCCILVPWQSIQILLISKTQKALDAFNYCHSLITLNRSHQKVVLNENTVLATDAKSQ